MRKEKYRACFKRNVASALQVLLVCAAATGCSLLTGFYADDLKITRLVINRVEGVIDHNEKIIEVTLPLGTDVRLLLPEIEFEGDRINPDPTQGKLEDFSKPVIYTVSSKNGNTASYAVLVTLGTSDTNRITAFKLDAVNQISVSITEEDEKTGTVYVVVPLGTELSGQTATIKHTGLSISPDGSAPQDFNQPVTYTVASGTDHERVYTVIVTDTPSTENNITSFAIDGVPGIITGTEIMLTVSAATSLVAVKPVMKVSTGATVEPDKNKARNFTSPVTYQVTSASGAVKTYRVTVNQTKTGTEVALASLDVDGYHLIPAFSAGTTEYTVTVYAEIIQITATATNANDKLVYVENNNEAVTSGEAFSSNVLSIEAENTVTVKVTAEGGATANYTLTVIRNEPDFPAGTVIDETFTVSDTPEWNNAISAITGGGNDKNYVINVIGDFDATGNYSTPFGGVTGITVAIRGNQTISLSNKNWLLNVGKNQRVILRDLTLLGRDDNFEAVIYVGSGGEFEMRGGATITGNNNYFQGGGVSVKNGSFTMRDNASVSGNIASVGGGVSVNNGSFTMRDNASVSGNYSNFLAGGVYVSDSTLIMRDNASVSGNDGKYLAGGVVIISSTFRIAGGTIYGLDEPSDLKNNADENAALFQQNSTSEYGTGGTDGETWVKNGDLSSTNDTIKVVNGVLIK